VREISEKRKDSNLEEGGHSAKNDYNKSVRGGGIYFFSKRVKGGRTPVDERGRKYQGCIGGRPGGGGENQPGERITLIKNRPWKGPYYRREPLAHRKELKNRGKKNPSAKKNCI